METSVPHSDVDARVRSGELKAGEAGAGDATTQPMPLPSAHGGPGARQEDTKREDTAAAGTTTGAAEVSAQDAGAPAEGDEAGDGGRGLSADVPPPPPPAAAAAHATPETTRADAAHAPVETTTALPQRDEAASASASTHEAAAPHTPKHMDSLGSGDEVFEPATADAAQQAGGAAVVPQGVQRALDEKTHHREQLQKHAMGARKIAFRAASVMEEQRRTLGQQQDAEQLCYWEAWQAHMDTSMQINDSLVQYMRAAAAGAAAHANTLVEASAAITPIITDQAYASGMGALVEGGTAPAPSLVASKLLTSRLRRGSSTSGAAAAGASSGGASAGGSSGAGGAAPAPLASPYLERVPASHAPSTLCAFITAVNDVHLQGARQLAEFANFVSGEVVGDTDGPLGKKGDGRRHMIARMTHMRMPEASTLLSMAHGYANMADEVRAAGHALAAQLQELDLLVLDAFYDFFVAANALGAVSPRPGAPASAAPSRSSSRSGSNKDMWLAELRYRRVCRVALAAKMRYVTGMADCFERYRTAEAQRSALLAGRLQAYTARTAALYDRVSDKGVGALGAALQTHADFFRSVQTDALSRIAALNAAAAGAPSGAHPGAVQTGDAARIAPTDLERGDAEEAAAVDAVAGSSGVVPDGHHMAAILSGGQLRLPVDPIPAVIAPFVSPLVARCGILSKTAGVLRSWRQHVAVLTRDGFLHLFATESSDCGCHPDVTRMICMWAAERPSTSAPAAPASSAAGGGAAHSAASHESVGSEGGAHDAPDVGDASCLLSPKSADIARVLPPPALPQHLVAMARNYATNVTDLLELSAEELMERAQKAAAAPSVSFPLSATTKLTAVNSAQTDTFELSDRTGFLGMSHKLSLRALSQDDCIDWMVAINEVVSAL